MTVVEDWCDLGTASRPRVWTLAALFFAADALSERIRSSFTVSKDEERVVAVLAAEGAVMFICQRAIVRAGCAFLMIDPMLPAARVEYLLDDSRAAMILLACSSDAASDLVTQSARPWLRVDVAMPPLDAVGSVQEEAERGGEGATTRETALFPPAEASRLMYVCYTSGSSGRPKGVAVTQGALRAYCVANAKTHHIGAHSRVLLTSAVSFDPSIGEAWTALLAGATLCLPSRAMVL